MKMLHYLLTMDVLFLDEVGQLSCEYLVSIMYGTDRFLLPWT